MSACEKYQEMLSALLDGELTETEQAEVRAHIASCDECRAMYEAFAAVIAAVSADEDVPDGLHDGIMARVNAAAKATKTQGKIIRLRSVLTAAACLVIVVGTVFALKNNLFSQAKSAADEAAPEEMELMLNASATVTASGAEAPMLASASADALANGAFEAGGAEEAKSETEPRATDAPAPESAAASSDSTAGVLYGAIPSVAEVRRLDEVMVLHDVEALMDALAPQETEPRFDPGTRESDCVVTLETDSGTERTLQIYFDDERVWVEEDGEVYLASCTPEEFEALR